jgi:hypothetical protein
MQDAAPEPDAVELFDYLVRWLRQQPAGEQNNQQLKLTGRS